MKKELDSAEEALVFIAELITEQKWLILPAIEEDGKFVVEYIEQKMYTAIDGKEYPDELWITKEGVPLFIQEMSEAHVRNTLRMILRNQRMVEQRLVEIFSRVNQDEEDEVLLEDIPDDSGTDADNEIVRQLKSTLSGYDHPDMPVPATAVKGPITLQ